jgi:hypothetical protein
MGGASSSSAGSSGLVPAPAKGDQAKFLRADGTWVVPTNTTYNAASTSAAGLMSADDKAKLDTITKDADAVSFTQSLTSGTAVGTITINGTTTTLYCQTNTNTTYSTMGAASSSAAGTSGLVPAPAKGDQAKFLRADATWATPTNTTYSTATTSANGLMSSTDKSKLDGIYSGATTVSISRSLTSGTAIGTITINGTATTLYSTNNTTYSAMSQAEATTGTATTARSITAAVLSDTIAIKLAGSTTDFTSAKTSSISGTEYSTVLARLLADISSLSDEIANIKSNYITATDLTS